MGTTSYVISLLLSHNPRGEFPNEREWLKHMVGVWVEIIATLSEAQYTPGSIVGQGVTENTP